MSEAIDRVEDAYTEGWAKAIKAWRHDGPSVEPHRRALRAALRVMADEIRELPLKEVDGRLYIATADIVELLSTYEGEHDGKTDTTDG